MERRSAAAPSCRWPVDPGRCPEGRAAAGRRDRADGGDPAGSEIEGVAQDDGTHNRDERTGDLLVNPLEPDDRHQDRDGHEQGRDACFTGADSAERVRELLERRAASVATPNIPATWPIATWIPTPVRKPIKSAVRQEVGNEPEPDDPRHDHEHRTHESGQAAHRHPRGETSAGSNASNHRQGPLRSPSTPTTRIRWEEPKIAKATSAGIQAQDHRHLCESRIAHHPGPSPGGRRQPR